MKSAFATTAVARWDFIAAATAAKACGYDGVELHASFDASVVTATNALFSDPRKIRHAYHDAGIQIASVSFVMHAKPDPLPYVIDIAAQMGCANVRILRADAVIHRGGFEAFAAKVLTMADTAAGAGVTLLLENEATVGSVSRLWRVIDGFNHPSIACCWNPGNGRLAGELPLVSIPMLNSRIRMVRLSHVTLNSDDALMLKILQRLAGIGFGGWLLVDEFEGPEEGKEAMLRETQPRLQILSTKPNQTKPGH